MAVALEAAFDQRPELCGKSFLVEQVVYAQSTATGFGRVRWPDTLFGRADGFAAELDLFEAVDDLVKVEDEVRTVGQEEPPIAVQPLLSERIQLRKEGRDVDDDS